MAKFGLDIVDNSLSGYTTATNWGLGYDEAAGGSVDTFKNIATGASGTYTWGKVSGASSIGTATGRSTTVGDFPALVRAQSVTSTGTQVFEIAGGTAGQYVDIQVCGALSTTTSSRTGIQLSNDYSESSSVIQINPGSDLSSDCIAHFSSFRFGSNGKITVTITIAAGSFSNWTAVLITDSDPLSINSVSGSADVGSTITVDVTNGGSAGSATLSYGSYSETMTNGTWGSSSIQLTRPTITSAHLFPGMVATLEITNSDSQSDSTSITIPEITNRLSITLEELGGIDWINLESGSLAIGDGLVYTPVLYSGGSPTEYTSTIAVDGSFSVDETAPDGTYTVLLRAWDATDGTWGTEGTVTLTLGPGSAATINGIIMQLIRTPFGLMIKPM